MPLTGGPRIRLFLRDDSEGGEHGVGGWINWLLPLAAVLLLGAAATYYLHRVRLPREQTAAGIAALSGMRWRDFIHLVLDALGRRGYERVFDRETASADSDYVLVRDGKRWLLSSRHGANYVLGSTAIAEFGNEIRLNGAAGGLLASPGRFASEAHVLAAAQRIELLDGPTLWPELEPLLSPQQRAAITAGPSARARRHLILAWSSALAVGAVLLVLTGPKVDQSDATGERPAAASATSASGPTGAAAATTAVTDPSTSPGDPRTLEQRRSAVARAISTLPAVDRALWSTQSTLLVHLIDENADPLSGICALLERDADLRAARIQLQPPAGSTRPVRFVQCRAY